MCRMKVFTSITVISVLSSILLWAQSDSPKQTNDSTGQTTEASPPTSSAPSSPNVPSPPDSTKLELVKGAKAVYPLAAAEKQLQGQVWLTLHISETGDVGDVDVVSGDPILVQAAVEAAKKWKFKPYVKNGHPVKVLYKTPFDFAFRGNVKDVTPPEDAPANLVAPSGSSSSSTGAANGSDMAAKPRVQLPDIVRVSQGVSTGLLLHKVAPIYPEGARRNRIQGTVLLQAMIDTNGRISDLQPISGPQELIPAAVGAVQQWRYRPYSLQGKPVKVQTQIMVKFTLQ